MTKPAGLMSAAAMRIHGEAQDVERMRRAMNLEPWDEWAEESRLVEEVEAPKHPRG